MPCSFHAVANLLWSFKNRNFKKFVKYSLLYIFLPKFLWRMWRLISKSSWPQNRKLRQYPEVVPKKPVFSVFWFTIRILGCRTQAKPPRGGLTRHAHYVCTREILACARRITWCDASPCVAVRGVKHVSLMDRGIKVRLYRVMMVVLSRIKEDNERSD